MRPSIEEQGTQDHEEISREKKPAVAEESQYDFEESKGILRHMNRVGDVIDTSAVQPGTDIIYEKKVALLNEAILDIGMGYYQWWTFVLTGFGWYTDQVFVLNLLTVAKYTGMVIGATIMPITADFIGRNPAFNVSLGMSSLFGFIAAGMPNFLGVATMSAFIGLTTGGNQAIDSCIFLEFIPASHQYLLTMQTTFFALAQAISVLIAWPFVVNYSCPSDTPKGQCGYLDNLGWRYAYWTFGAINFVMFALRFLFRTYETPKWLLGQGRDADAVRVLHSVATRNGTTTWLTLDHFQRIDAELASTQDASPATNPSPAAAAERLKGTIRQRLSKFQPHKLAALFATPKMAASTSLIILLWLLIGLAFPLYFCFIPLYLEAKGLSTSGGSSTNATFRTYCIQAACGVPGAILSGLLVDVRKIGRKGTGAMASVLSASRPTPPHSSSTLPHLVEDGVDTPVIAPDTFSIPYASHRSNLNSINLSYVTAPEIVPEPDEQAAAAIPASAVKLATDVQPPSGKRVYYDTADQTISTWSRGEDYNDYYRNFDERVSRPAAEVVDEWLENLRQPKWVPQVLPGQLRGIGFWNDEQYQMDLALDDKEERMRQSGEQMQVFNPDLPTGLTDVSVPKLPYAERLKAERNRHFTWRNMYREAGWPETFEVDAFEQRGREYLDEFGEVMNPFKHGPRATMYWEFEEGKLLREFYRRWAGTDAV
ncbi:hypothetical protein SLS57_001772 [Botryosphaeria dothidea]